ncbi:Bacteriophytochrome cph2 [Thiorhodovibrio winogradskyi]|uniref:Bacteriophytochrome cph2 n=1 Tax=Thiorhodovibrio winogradskyi TaxID=77007 RepID=A0ABZ0SFA4_9GAMM|nr:EAL domain-containing protein [Thiorhodovibrio winogradskyi]
MSNSRQPPTAGVPLWVKLWLLVALLLTLAFAVFEYRAYRLIDHQLRATLAGKAQVLSERMLRLHQDVYALDRPRASDGPDAMSSMPDQADGAIAAAGGFMPDALLAGLHADTVLSLPAELPLDIDVQERPAPGDLPLPTGGAEHPESESLYRVAIPVPRTAACGHCHSQPLPDLDVVLSVSARGVRQVVRRQWAAAVPLVLGLWLLLLSTMALLLHMLLGRRLSQLRARLGAIVGAVPVQGEGPHARQGADAQAASSSTLGDELESLGTAVDALLGDLRLRESELQAVRGFARIGFWSCDLKAGRVDWSPEVESLIGWRANMHQQPLRSLFKQRVDSRDYPQLGQALENALASAQGFACEFRVRFPEDCTTWLSATAEVLRDERGKPRHIRGMLQYIGERKEAESQRQEYVTLFERLFRATGTLMSFSDPETGRLIEVNPSFERITGYTREQAVGNSWSELGLTTADQREAMFEQLQRDGAVRNRHLSGHKSNGDCLELQYSGTLIEIDGHVRVLSMAEDITDLVRGEEALRRSEERLELAMRGSHDGLWDLNLQTHEVYFAPRWKEMLGYQDAELPNDMSTWRQLIEPESDKRAWALLDAVIAGNEPDFALDIRLRHKDGHWVDVLSRAHLVHNADGEPLRLVGTHTDVSPLKKALADVERERKRAADYLKVAGVVMVALDAQGRVTLINDKGCALLGRDQADILGRDWFEQFLPPSARAGMRASFERILQGDVELAEKNDGPIVSVDGNEHIISWRNNPLRDADGRIVGTLSSGLDVTERRRVEAELAQERSFLQHVIDGIDDPIMVIGEDYCLIRVNRAAARRAEARGLSLKDLTCHALLYGSDSPCAERARDCPLASVLKEHQPTKVVHLDESDSEESGEHSYEISASPLLDEHGQIVGIIEVARDISEQLAVAAELRRSELSVLRLSQYDLLTSLPNRLLFADRLSAGIAEARRRGASLAVMIVDLDRFKHINDSFDHHEGDEVLKSVASRLQQLVGEQETLARLGGDEFGIIPAPFHGKREPSGFAERIHEALQPPFMLHGQRVLVGASIGIALYPAQGNTADDLLRKADAALYSAKADGGKTSRFFTEELTADARDRLVLEASLQEALEREEFELHYQPQIDFRAGKVSGIEALVRWRHPRQGLIAPGRFIPLAEESGLINPLGDWVLRTACEQMQAWREAGVVAPEVMMSVNLSARQFEQVQLADKVLDILRHSGLAPAAVEIEITESTVMQSPRRSIDCLRQLRQAGVKIAVDDFGTGYSSMSYLKRLPLTKLKIDRSFVSDIPDDTNDVAIVRAIIALGTSLSLELLAEGIETQQQRDFLLQEGCQLGQGYLFAKPLSAEDFVRFAGDWVGAGQG